MDIKLIEELVSHKFDVTFEEVRVV